MVTAPACMTSSSLNKSQLRLSLCTFDLLRFLMDLVFLSTSALRLLLWNKKYPLTLLGLGKVVSSVSWSTIPTAVVQSAACKATKVPIYRAA
jgi:hypothetical protein